MYEDEKDLFQREPYAARFKAAGGSFTFAIAAVHTKPGLLEEIRDLHEVFEWMRAQFPEEDDFIVVGDLNASCDYAKAEELDELLIRDPDLYSWLIDDDADTNLAKSACAYDRIIVSTNTESSVLASGVDRAFTDKKVSDHWPVWAEFSVEE